MKRTIYINEEQFEEISKPKKKTSHLNPDKWYEDKADFSISSSEGDLGYAHVVGDAGYGGDAAAGGMMCESEENYDADIHKYIESYLDFLENEGYNINPRPAIELDTTHQDGINIKTGYYSPEEKKVVVFVYHRHIKDIMRSFAHEMVHHMQNIRNPHMDWGFGGNLKDDPTLRGLEGEAYHVGNILFREWTEWLKSRNGLNESRTKEIKNDQGELVPEKCDKCGGEVVCQIHGEPVYVCKKCGKYFGTMPCHLNESVNWAEKLRDLKKRRDPDNIENWDSLDEATESDVDLSSFKIQDSLNPKIWVNDLMDSRVRLKLLDIAQDFVEFLDVTWVKPEDTIVVGSIANYNWSKYSDIDLHVVMDYSKVDDRKKFVENYFQSKKKEWNDTHDEIKIFGHPVELYVQDKDADNASSAVYSLDKNKWLKKPSKNTFTKKDIDSPLIKKKASEIMTDIEGLEKKKETADGDDYKNRKLYDDTSDLIDDITSKRKTSLSKTKDEMNTDNLVFKVLRRNGYLDKLFNLRDKTYDKMNSLP